MNYTTTLDSPYGYGLVRVDKNSNVIWKYSGHAHHDFHVEEDGSIYTLTSKFVSAPAAIPQLHPRILDEFVVKLSADGKEQKRISIMRALIESDYLEALQMYHKSSENPSSGNNLWDPIHANTIQVIGEDFAEHHQFAEPGQILLSLRGLDLVGLLEPATEKIVWGTRGFWAGQHHPVPKKNGHLLVFDNNGFGGPGGASRILELDPTTREVVWSYTGTAQQPFWSKKRGSIQVLPNDNLLVTSSRPGRIFEVTRDGRVVWDFYNPERQKRKETIFTAQVTSGLRYSDEQLEFLGDSDNMGRRSE